MFPVTVIGERDTRAERLVGGIEVGSTVKLIGSAARSKVEKPGSDLTEFGRKIRSLQRELLDRLDRRLNLIGHTGVETARRLLPFEQNAKCAGRIAVHLDRVPTRDRRARRQLNKRERIADRSGADRKIDGKIVDRVTGNRGRLLGALGFE